MLLPYLKFNLLAMKRTLEDDKKAKELEERAKSNPDIQKNINIASMIEKINELLKLLESVNLPFYLPNDYKRWPKYIRENPQKFGLTQKDIEEKKDEKFLKLLFWNPDLFPKPKVDEEGNVSWILPSI